MTDMKRRRHSPEQAIRKLRGGERRLNAGEELGLVLRQMEITESTWNRWRSTLRRDEGRGRQGAQGAACRERPVEEAVGRGGVGSRRCSRSSRRENGDPGSSPGRCGAAGESVRGVAASCVSCCGPGPLDPASAQVPEPGCRRCLRGVAVPVRAASSPLGLAQGSRGGRPRRPGSESQAHAAAVAGL